MPPAVGWVSPHQLIALRQSPTDMSQCKHPLIEALPEVILGCQVDKANPSHGMTKHIARNLWGERTLSRVAAQFSKFCFGLFFFECCHDGISWKATILRVWGVTGSSFPLSAPSSPFSFSAGCQPSPELARKGPAHLQVLICFTLSEKGVKFSLREIRGTNFSTSNICFSLKTNFKELNPNFSMPD